MKKLTVSRDAAVAQEVVHRLNQAGIKASITTDSEAADVYVGSSPMQIVWVDDLSDEALAVQIVREVEAERMRRMCPECRYDLRGHAGTTRCPECGRALTVPGPDRTCPQCHEAVPDNFEICWNCGASLI